MGPIKNNDPCNFLPSQHLRLWSFVTGALFVLGEGSSDVGPAAFTYEKKTPEDRNEGLAGEPQISLCSIGNTINTSSLVDFPASHLSFPGFFTIDFVGSPSTSGGLGSLCDSRRQLSALASWLWSGEVYKKICAQKRSNLESEVL